jgi:hypothetical protein
MKFRKGDRVRCVDAVTLSIKPNLTKDKIYTVLDVLETEFNQPYLVVLSDLCREVAVKARRFKLLQACGNQNCCCSTGICERLTFGSGALDDYGYWEFPCWTCARDYEKENPGEDAWPPL